MNAGTYHGLLVNQFAQAFRALDEPDRGRPSRPPTRAPRAPMAPPAPRRSAPRRPVRHRPGPQDPGRQRRAAGRPAARARLAAMANIRGKQNVLFKVNEAGTDSLLREGIIGRLEGMDLRNSAGHGRHQGHRRVLHDQHGGLRRRRDRDHPDHRHGHDPRRRRRDLRGRHQQVRRRAARLRRRPITLAAPACCRRSRPRHRSHGRQQRPRRTSPSSARPSSSSPARRRCRSARTGARWTWPTT
jgi:hypothetical protein